MKEDGPLKKTNIATYAEISYDRFMVYLQWMKSRQMVEENDGYIYITEKGMRTYNELVEWIVEYVGKLKFTKGRL